MGGAPGIVLMPAHSQRGELGLLLPGQLLVGALAFQPPAQGEAAFGRVAGGHVQVGVVLVLAGGFGVAFFP